MLICKVSVSSVQQSRARSNISESSQLTCSPGLFAICVLFMQELLRYF